MSRYPWFLRVLCFLSVLPGASFGQQAEHANGKRIVAYFAEWGVYQRNYHVTNIPADKLTHINYAFAKITNGECALIDSYAAIDKAYPGDTWDAGVLRGSFHQLQLLKKKYPHLQTLIAVGGWTQSGQFSDVALTEESRSKFARSCVRFMRKYGFGGVDIDWEFPVSGGLPTNKTRPGDRTNYTLLLAELRKELNLQGKADKTHYVLTIAAPAGPATFANLELSKVHAHLDWINLMTYDFHGGWSPRTNFSASLFSAKDDPSEDEMTRKNLNVNSAVRAYLKAGVPADKLVVGVPFYGRGWAGVPDKNNGLFQKPGPNPPSGTWEPGVFDYKDLAKNYLGMYTRHWHDDAKAPWLFNPKTGIMISYEDAESLRAKAEYIRDQNLGGVMFWELSGDDARGTLLNGVSVYFVGSSRV